MMDIQSKTDKKETCNACKFYEFTEDYSGEDIQSEDRYGDCCRYPPASIPITIENVDKFQFSYTTAGWSIPVVYGTGWCGEWCACTQADAVVDYEIQYLVAKTKSFSEDLKWYKTIMIVVATLTVVFLVKTFT